MTGEEKRVDSQIIVGLLVDRGGRPLQIWEGNRPRPPPSPSSTLSRPLTVSRSSASSPGAGIFSSDGRDNQTPLPRPAGPGPSSPATSSPDTRGSPTAHAGDATLERPPRPGPGRWWGWRATPPFTPSHLVDAGEVVSSYHELRHTRSVLCA